jgi:hypothetical protein
VGKKFQWPLSDNVLAKFIHFASTSKNLKQSTIKSYISSFALYQNLHHMDNSACYSFQTKLLLKGAKNLEFYKENKNLPRKAMTYPLLKILCHQIASTNWSKVNKQVFWASLTVAFFGSMRFGEILSSHRDQFNPNETLLWEDIKLMHSSAIITVKIPKTKNLKGEYVDIFEIPDERFCPIKALKVLKDCANNFNPKLPVFMFDNGCFLTKDVLNTTLHTLLYPVLGSSAFEYSGHSFRAALPSAMAGCPDLADDEQVKLWGRWTSGSFKSYTRLKTSQKKFLFEKILMALNRQ